MPTTQVPVIAPPRTAAELLDRAKALAPVLRERAAEIEEARRKAVAFASNLPWLTTSQHEDVERVYVADRVAASRAILQRNSDRAAELRGEYNARYELLKKRCVAAALGGVAVAVGLAMLAVGIAIGSSAQIALFVAPLLVLLSFVVGPNPLALVFNGYELAGLVFAVLIANFVTQDGESNWFEGAQLLALYAVLGLVFFYA